MKQLVITERLFLFGHIVAMAFGLAGLLLVLPHPEFILALSSLGQRVFQWGMAGGGVLYILLGTAAVAVYAYQTLGMRKLLGFMIPAIGLSLSSELLGTSTGFPFGEYSYLNGLGYKIAGLVPFTIPLSWFYLGFSTYVLACAGLNKQSTQSPGWLIKIGSVLLGALLLTSWDFVLDPAMSQTAYPFWEWKQAGAFFGMPYENFAGWMGTGVVFMSVAAILWGQVPLTLSRGQLRVPLIIYISNFAFAAIMSLAAGIYIPILLGVALGLLPAIWLWQVAPQAVVAPPQYPQRGEANSVNIKPVSLGALRK